MKELNQVCSRSGFQFVDEDPQSTFDLEEIAFALARAKRPRGPVASASPFSSMASSITTMLNESSGSMTCTTLLFFCVAAKFPLDF
jgi:hypothetical protein